MLDVPGDERGSSGAGRALRIDLESQLRRAPGRRRAHAPGESRDGGGCRAGGQLRRRAADALMENFTRHTGLVAALDRGNVDTDQIIPKQFLKSIRRTGFGANLFDEWRYLDRGEPGQDPAGRHPNPNFFLNLPRYRSA